MYMLQHTHTHTRTHTPKTHTHTGLHAVTKREREVTLQTMPQGEMAVELVQSCHQQAHFN